MLRCLGLFSLYSIVLLLTALHGTLNGEKGLRQTRDNCVTGFWSRWGDWQRCEAFCNQSRKRFCDYSNSVPTCRTPCAGGNGVQNRTCTGGDCCPHGFSQWGDWAPWTICDVCSKNRPVRSRLRPCQKNQCKQACLSGDGKQTQFCEANTTCKKDDNGLNNTHVNPLNKGRDSNDLSTTAKVMIGLLLVLFVGVVVSVSILIVRRRHRAKGRTSREPEVIDINVGLPGLMQQTITDDASSVSSASDASSQMSMSASGAESFVDPSVANRARKASSMVDSVATSKALRSDLESGISEDNPQGQDIYYHAPGFFYD